MNLSWLYIAALYAAAIFAVRHLIRWRIAIVFYLVVLVLFFRPLTGPYINFAADVIEMIPPWSAHSHVTKYNVSNLETHDATMQLIPWGHQVREAWRHGTIPLWNALAGGGYPLLANGQSSALAPTRILALPVPAPYWIAAEAALKVLIALTFTFLYLRRRGASEIAAITGAISFALSTYVIGWLHYAHTTVAVFAPAIFLAIDLIADAATPKRIAFGAIVIAMMIFGGHVESVIYIGVLAAVYVAWIPPSRLPALLLTAIAGALIASPFLAPFAEAALRSLRWQEVHGLQYTGVPFSDRASLTLLIEPRFFGGRPLPWGPMTCETITGFAGILGIAGAIGVIVAKQWRDRRFAFLVGGLIALAVVADIPPFGTAMHVLFPHIALARFRLAVCWSSAVFASMFIDLVSKRIGVSVAALTLASLFFLWNFPDRATKLASLADAIPSFIVLAIVLIPRARPLVPAAILVELLVANHGWNPTFPADKFYPRTPLIEALTRLDNDGSRIVGLGEPLYPNTNAMFGFPSAQAHDPMESAAYDEMLRTSFGYNAHDYYAKWTDPNTPLARWIITAPGVALDKPMRYDGDDGRIYENVNARAPSQNFALYPHWRSSFFAGVAASILTLLALAGAALRTARLRPDRSTR